MTVLYIMLLIPSHPALHPRLIKRRRIKPHDLRVAENAQQRRNIVRSHPAQVEAWGFEENGVHQDEKAAKDNCRRRLSLLK